MMAVLITLVLLGLSGHCQSGGRTEFEMKMYESGREQFEMLNQKSRMPRQGECWKTLLKDLQVGCDRLDEEQHATLALGLADCFLEMSGEQRHSCGSQQDKEARMKCTRNMPERAFSVYSKFFTHVANLCFYLKSSIWQELAQNTIESLLLVSQAVDGQLKDIKDENERLLAFQQKSISLQEQVIDSGANLGQVLKESRESVALLMLEIRENTMEQQLALVDLSQRLSALQAWAVGEVSWLESLAYFAIAVCVTYLSTAWTRASEARGWIFGLLFVGVLCEQAVFKFLLSHYEGSSNIFHKENLYFWVWKLRYLFLTFCVSTYVYCVATYVDYSQVNYKLLHSIHDIVRSIQTTSEVSALVSKTSTLEVRNTPPRSRQATPERREDERSRRETSVTFVRVEQKTYSNRSPTPLRSRQKAMAIVEVDEVDSPNGSRYNLRSTPLRQLHS